MIKDVYLGEEIVIVTKNKVGLLADVSRLLSERGINIEAVLGYEVGRTAKLMLVTKANIAIMNELRKKKYKSVKETEVVIVDLENKPGSLKVITTELKAKKIDIKYIYVTSPVGDGSSRMILQTSDNETTIALLTKYIQRAEG